MGSTTAEHRPDPRDRARSPQAPRPPGAARHPGERDLPVRLEHLAKTPPGTRPMAPLPGTTPRRRDLTSKNTTGSNTRVGMKTRTVVPVESVVDHGITGITWVEINTHGI